MPITVNIINIKNVSPFILKEFDFLHKLKYKSNNLTLMMQTLLRGVNDFIVVYSRVYLSRIVILKDD